MRRKFIVGLASVAIAGAISARWLVRRAAPEVTFATLSGQKITTADLRGKVVLVNFWATWCPDCRKEMPRIVDTHREFAPRGLETLAVAVRRDDPQRVAEYAKAQGLPFRIVLDSDGTIAREFGKVHITPTTFLIDKRGRVLKEYVGEPHWKELHALLEAALADPV